MIIKRQALEAAMAVVPTEEGRRVFDGHLLIRDNGELVATDGHMAFIVRDTSPYPDEDFPVVADAPFQHGPKGDFVVSLATLKTLLATAPKVSARATLPILASVQVGQNGEPNKVTFAATDLRLPRVVTVENHPDPFPNVDRVFKSVEEQKKTVTVTLNAELLENLCAAARTILRGTKGSTPMITFTVPVPKEGDLTDAVKAEVEKDGLKLDAVLMPCRR